MITKDYLEDFNSPIRKITGKAELITSSADTKSGNYVTIDNPDITKPITAQLELEKEYVKGELVTDSNWSYDYPSIENYTTETFVTITKIENDYMEFSDGGYWEGSGQLSGSDSGTVLSEVFTLGETVCLYGVPDDYTLYLYRANEGERAAVGKNLFNPSKMLAETNWVEENGYLTGEAIKLHQTYNASTEGYLSLVGLNSVSISFYGYHLAGDGERGLIFYIVYDDDTKDEICVNSNTEKLYTCKSNITKKPKKLCFSYGSKGFTHYLRDIQIEAGTKNTSFVPYGKLSVDVYGKNVMPFPYYNTTITYGGVTYTDNKDGSISVEGYVDSWTEFVIANENKPYFKDKVTFDLLGDYKNLMYQIDIYEGNTRVKSYEPDSATLPCTIDFSLYPNATRHRVCIKRRRTNCECVGTIYPIAIQGENIGGVTYIANEEGKIENIKAIAPTTTIIPTLGLSVKADYAKEVIANTFSYTDALQSITIDRIGEKNKFFGFIVSQKATINLLDRNRELEISNGNCFKTYFNINENNFVDNFPRFFVSEAKRNETTNALTITALDYFGAVAGITVSELGLDSYTIREFAEACAALHGLNLEIKGVEDETVFDTYYEGGANFEGTEDIRDALKAIAEATQTICYVSPDSLVFRRLGAAAADLNIEKKHYFTLTNKGVKTLANICHATELGDNVISSSSLGGETQYVRDNPFWEKREDIADVVDNAIAAIGGIVFNAFECKWRGNFLAEIGDRLDITTKDDKVITSYLLDDTITYKGGYNQKSSWTYESGKEETPSNPSTLGEVIKQTFAKVDKANKQINIVASESSANKEAIAALQLNTNSISASVSNLEEVVKDNQETTNDELATLRNKVDLQITPEQVNIVIQEEMNKGVDKVITSNGYSFDSEGMKVSKSDSDISTTISHEGMEVAAAGKEMLVANHEGVNAVNLKANNYIIIDGKSRFQSWNNRTACFWIGG